jgi:hypothetical protein
MTETAPTPVTVNPRASRSPTPVQAVGSRRRTFNLAELTADPVLPNVSPTAR